MKQVKTNAMRILDQAKIAYSTHSYDVSDGQIDGLSVAAKCGQDPKYVFKTLITQGHSKQYYVFVIPVEHELSLKEGAKLVGEKSIEMIHVKDIQKVSGYIRGGCSPIGMKKVYPTIIDSSAEELDYFIFSGGKQGLQIMMNPKDLISFLNCKTGVISH